MTRPCYVHCSILSCASAVPTATASSLTARKPTAATKMNVMMMMMMMMMMMIMFFATSLFLTVRRRHFHCQNFHTDKRCVEKHYLPFHCFPYLYQPR